MRGTFSNRGDRVAQKIVELNAIGIGCFIVLTQSVWVAIRTMRRQLQIDLCGLPV